MLVCMRGYTYSDAVQGNAPIFSSARKIGGIHGMLSGVIPPFAAIRDQRVKLLLYGCQRSLYSCGPLIKRVTDFIVELQRSDEIGGTRCALKSSFGILRRRRKFC